MKMKVGDKTHAMIFVTFLRTNVYGKASVFVNDSRPGFNLELRNSGTAMQAAAEFTAEARSTRRSEKFMVFSAPLREPIRIRSVFMGNSGNQERKTIQS
jgi:hypothetical protein